jgi:manganese-dependent ADP-ribose/CDP-alcohol diphosphatase
LRDIKLYSALKITEFFSYLGFQINVPDENFACIFPCKFLIFHMPVRRYSGIPPTIDIKQDSTVQKPLFSFGIIADAQYTDCKPAGNRYYSSSIDKLENAVSVFRENSVDFIINLGDLIERDYESYKPVLNILNSSRIKTYHLTGNHDYSVDPRYLTQLPVFSESGEGYYSIIYRKYRLIFLNGNDISKYSSANKTRIRQADELISTLKKSGEINAIDWNGGISSTQIDWMIRQLDEAAENSEKVILFCHFPIAPENVHNLLNYKEINGILLKYTNIIAWFSGHNHQGNYTTINKVHYVTFRGMVETRSKNSFAIVEAYNDKLSIRGYGRENSLILTF